jgi:hypothetical protein
MAIPFLKKVQSTPKVKSVKRKIAQKKKDLKGLSREYKRLIKSESKRLARKRK